MIAEFVATDVPRTSVRRSMIGRRGDGRLTAASGAAWRRLRRLRREAAARRRGEKRWGLRGNARAGRALRTPRANAATGGQRTGPLCRGLGGRRVEPRQPARRALTA